MAAARARFAQAFLPTRRERLPRVSGVISRERRRHASLRLLPARSRSQGPGYSIAPDPITRLPSSGGATASVRSRRAPSSPFVRRFVGRCSTRGVFARRSIGPVRTVRGAPPALPAARLQGVYLTPATPRASFRPTSSRGPVGGSLAGRSAIRPRISKRPLRSGRRARARPLRRSRPGRDRLGSIPVTQRPVRTLSRRRGR